MHWRQSTVRTRLLILLLVFIVIPLFSAVLVNIVHNKQLLKEEIIQSNQSILETHGYHIGKYIESILSASNMISMDSAILDMLVEDSFSDKYRFIVTNKELTRKLSDVKNYILPGTGEVTVINLRGIVYSTSAKYSTAEYEKVAEQAWFRETIRKSGFIHWFSQDGQYLSMARVIKYGINSSELAVLLIQVKTDEIMINGPLNEKNQIISLIDDQNCILASTDAKLIGRSTERNRLETITGEVRKYQLFEMVQPNWALVMSYSEEQLVQSVSQANQSLYVVMFIFFVLFVVLISLISITITNPIRKLEGYIRQTHNLAARQRIEVSGPKEIHSLLRHFNLMMDRLAESLEHNEEERKKKEAARLQALQAQINPHFLFNTLNMIKWSAYMSEAPNIAEMVSSLGRLLELSINRKGDFLPLNEELEHLKLYMELQQLRFQESIELQVEVPESLLRLQLPKLTLQPIVENAILHGFRNKQGEKNTVFIRVLEEEMQVILQVEDNGLGMEPEQVRHLLTQSEAVDKRRFSGIGLRNVLDRIQLYYGNMYGLSITSEVGRGTLVEIRIPVQHQGGGEYDEADSG
jgi:sensor histidine kinase YesM